MKLKFIVAIIACFFAVSTLATCTWESPGGKSYDFTGSKDTEVFAVTDFFIYSFAFCDHKPKNAECAADGAASSGCVYDVDKFWFVTGRWDKTKANGPASIVEKPEGGLTLTFENGGQFPSGLQSRLIVELDCANTSKASFLESFAPYLRLSIQSPLGCPSDGGLS